MMTPDESRETSVRQAIETAQRAAAEAKLELERLRAASAARRLTPQQRERLTAALVAIRDRIPTIGFTRLKDEEALRYADDILEVFKAVGIHGGLTTTGAIFPPHYGVEIGGDPDSILTGAFEWAGIPTKPTMKGAGLSILVGLKPTTH